MAELHANQISFRAPDTAKANLARQADYISEPLMRLGMASENYARQKAKIQDIQLNEDITTLAEKTRQKIADAKATNAEDYDLLVEESVSDWENIMSKYDDATRARLSNRNPNAYQNYMISVKEQVLEKKTNQLKQEVINDIPRLTSEAAMGTYGPDGRGYVVKKIQAQLGDLVSVQELDEIMHKVHSEFDRYEVSELIVQGKWNEARAKLLDVKNTATLSPTERIQFEEAIANGEYQEAKAKVEAEKAKEKGEDVRLLQLKEIVANSIRKSTPDNPTDAQVENLINLVAQGYLPMGYNEEGVPTFAYMEDVSPATALSWASELRKLQSESTTALPASAKAYSEISMMLSEAKDKEIKNLDPVFIAELEAKVNQPFVYNNSNSAVKEVVKKSYDLINRANRIVGATGWSETKDQPYINQKTRIPFDYKRVYSPAELASGQMPFKSGDEYFTPKTIAQTLANLTATRQNMLEKSGHPVKIGSFGQLGVSLATYIQAATDEQERKLYGIPYVTDDRIQSVYNRYIAYLITSKKFDEEIQPTKVEDFVRDYLTLLKGSPIEMGNENIDWSIKNLSDWLSSGLKQEDYYETLEWFKKIMNPNAVSPNRYKGLVGDRGTYQPINKYNSKVGDL